MSLMPARSLIAILVALVSLSACTLTRPPSFAPAPGAAQTSSGTAQPAPGTPAPSPAGATPAPPEHPYTQPPKQFRLSAASSALVAQAHTQAAGGDFGQSAATLERALRIEPDNPLLWIELGRARLGENNPAQADAMGRKALALATGDPAAQSSAWHLIADALRARGRNGEAAEAEQHAQGLSPR
jgi:tetratricopeptide (TPR) repeat protein